MAAVVQEVACPPDQLEVDVVASFFGAADGVPDGPAGLLNRRLGYCLNPRKDPPTLLVRCNSKVAAEWALFLCLGEDPPSAGAELEKILHDVLEACSKAGFRRVALAPPQPDGCQRNEWVRALTRAAETHGMTECLITFDHSYLHDHGGPVF